MYYRRQTYRKHWKELISFYGSLCFWCREEPATCIDHVVPYSWDQDNSIENLVPSCALCNAIAGSKVFDGIEHKRQYILNRKERKGKLGKRMLRCQECLLPYVQYEHSPSLCLCPECYDREYGTEHTKMGHWQDWLRLLAAAGIEHEAHRQARTHYGACTKARKRQFVYQVLHEMNILYEQRQSALEGS